MSPHLSHLPPSLPPSLHSPVAFEKISKRSEFITVEDLKDLVGSTATEEQVADMMREQQLSPGRDKISYSKVLTD